MLGADAPLHALAATDRAGDGEEVVERWPQVGSEFADDERHDASDPVSSHHRAAGCTGAVSLASRTGCARAVTGRALLSTLGDRSGNRSASRLGGVTLASTGGVQAIGDEFRWIERSVVAPSRTQPGRHA